VYALNNYRIWKASDEVYLSQTRLATRCFGDWNEDLCRFVTYKTGFLLECLVLSFGLRSSSSVGAAMLQAARCLPPVWAASLSGVIQGTKSTPSASTLSRARLYVDVGFMLCMQQEHALLLAESPILFGLVDSSPQGGRNWELLEMYGIRGPDVFEAADQARLLMNHLIQGADDCEEHERLRAKVASFVFHHVFPPTALGTRRSSLAMKLHACSHSLRLENMDWQRTEIMSQHFVSLTSDMGTEMNFNSVEGVDVGAAFPYWCKMGLAGDNDVDAAGDVDGKLDSRCKVSFATSLYIPGFPMALSFNAQLCPHSTCAQHGQMSNIV
jgi:hypothetical protein